MGGLGWLVCWLDSLFGNSLASETSASPSTSFGAETSVEILYHDGSNEKKTCFKRWAGEASHSLMFF